MHGSRPIPAVRSRSSLRRIAEQDGYRCVTKTEWPPGLSGRFSAWSESPEAGPGPFINNAFVYFGRPCGLQLYAYASTVGLSHQRRRSPKGPVFAR
jgi:hypothetical protein